MPHNIVTGESLELATLRTKSNALQTEPLCSLRPFVNMTSCVRGLPFVTWIKPKSHLIGTMKTLAEFWDVPLLKFSYPVGFVSEPLASQFLYTCELWML